MIRVRYQLFRSMFKLLSRLGFIAGFAYVIALLVAMPLKHWFGLSEVSTLIFSCSAVLLCAFYGCLLRTCLLKLLPYKIIPIALVISILPFGLLLFDQIIVERYRASV